MEFTSKLGIDLGTANLLVYKKGKGIVLNEPTVVAINTKTKRVLAVGNDAREMLGRTPGNITAIRPMKDGVIAEYKVTTAMLTYIRKKTVRGPQLGRPICMICVPSGVTKVERRAVIKAAYEAGFRKAVTIEEPMAAAIGAGLPISVPGGNMIVDIGGGTTDIAVISLGGIVLSASLRVGGNKFDEAIVRHVRNVYNLAIGEPTAEEIKIRIGSASILDPELRMEVRGRDVLAGMPKVVQVTSEEIREALGEPVKQIAEKLCAVLEATPPELASDVIERGIVLTGGGALLRGFDKLLEQMTEIPVKVADNVLDCVAIGTGRALEELDKIIESGAVSTI